MFFKKNKLTVEEQMLNYMKEKYQEDFIPGLCEEANWAYSYDSMTVYSDKFPGEFISVYRYEKKVFKDNYLGYLYREEIENIVYKIAEPLFGKCRVLMEVGSLPTNGELKKDAALEEYLKNASSSTSITIYIQEFNPLKSYKQCLEILQTKFKLYLLPHELNIYFLKPDKILDEITRKSESGIHDNLGEDSWFVKEAFFSFLEDYIISNNELEQL